MPSHTCGQNRLGERQRGGPEAWVLMPLSLTLQPSEALGHFLSTEDINFFCFSGRSNGLRDTSDKATSLHSILS